MLISGHEVLPAGEEQPDQSPGGAGGAGGHQAGLDSPAETGAGGGDQAEADRSSASPASSR